MALANHYRVLGLRTGASFGDVKLAYRNLARLYHPDVNPGDQRAKDKFIQVTQAYQALSAQLSRSYRSKSRAPKVTTVDLESPPTPPSPTSSKQAASPREEVRVNEYSYAGPKAEPADAAEIHCEVHRAPGVNSEGHTLKVSSFHQLRSLFQERRFPRAVALVEGLVSRFPDDLEVRQWHAVTYYRWGKDLVAAENFNKARACFKKALRVDPQNRSLQVALLQDFDRLEVLSQHKGSSPGSQSAPVVNSA
jgi:tetratricopeptide (TPR) repeat protein